jgi:hypothetical protein
MMGKKIKQRAYTKNPIPDSVIKQVESLGHRACPGAFDFVNRNIILFEWNDKVDKHQKN